MVQTFQSCIGAASAAACHGGRSFPAHPIVVCVKEAIQKTAFKNANFYAGNYVTPVSYFPVIMDAFDTHPDMNSFILKKHGLVALGDTIEAATYIAELVEETAQIAVLAKMCEK